MIEHVTTVIEGSDQRSMLVGLTCDDQIANPPVVLFVHGFKGFKDWGHFPKVGDEMAKAGFAFISFNFTHNGTTLDHPTDFVDLEAFGNNNYHKELFDTEQVIQGISNGSLFSAYQLNREQIYLLGHSRGGAISIVKTSENYLVKGLVTWNSVANMKRTSNDFDVWKRDGVVYVPNARTNQQMPMYYQFVEDYFAQEDRYHLKQSCARIDVPSLFIHATDDTTVPFSEAGMLHQWTPNSQLLLIENGNHTFGGKHPFEENELPNETQRALEATIQHFRSLL